MKEFLLEGLLNKEKKCLVHAKSAHHAAHN